MSSIGNLSLKMTLEAAQFLAEMRKAAGASRATANAISSAMGIAKGAVTGFLGALSVDALLNVTKHAFDYVDAIQDLSDHTGASTKSIQEFRYAAQLAGSSIENADAGLEKFAKTLGQAEGKNTAAMDTMKKYGITSHDVDEAVRQAADTISKYDSKAQQAAATAELFGKKNQNLTATMASGRQGLSEMAQKAEDLGIVLDKDVISNAGQVNDKLDTMQMILSAQLAGAIVKNADALVSLANGFMAAATAAANFFNQMDVKRLASVANGVGMNSDLGVLLQGRIQGKSLDETQSDALKSLRMTSAGRSNRYKFLADSYNGEIRKGTDKNLPFMQAMVAERQDILKQELASRRGLKPPTLPKGVLPTSPSSAGNKDGEDPASKEATRRDAFIKELKSAEMAEISAKTQNARSIEDQSRYQRQLADIDQRESLRDIDQKVKSGKLREDEANELRALINTRHDEAARSIDNEKLDALAKHELALTEDSIENQLKLNGYESELAMTAAEKRRLALQAINLETSLQKQKLEEIIASKLATDAEKERASDALKNLPYTQQKAQEVARRSTMGPLESYLNEIPHTRDQMNEALENVQVEGLQKLQDGLAGVLEGTKSVGEAFSDMAKTIISSLINIGLQQVIIAPLAKALFGGGTGGGGGLLGSLLGSIIPGLKGQRANGGMSQPGDYLVGERGPEIVRMGAPANVIPNNQLRASNDNGGARITFASGAITSNDPAMVRMMVAEGVAQAMPLNAKQATDRTLKVANRRNL